ncbi:hypothetical protein [Pseudomonas syringae]|uniref:hypothetical protein n=1 Tax=Pseudomonas syringae TaxID=317 RepID=UPI001F37317A|nr:hypothetical protein [Pseudomonas syringae]MCF9000512.1 hypothetical protein [Pseudomonas syringae]
MAFTQKQRNDRTSIKRQKAGEEELRLRVRPGTKQALSELMAWAGIEEQGEALTLMIHHLHNLGPGGALPMLEIPRHEITVSPVVARKLELSYQREALRVCQENQ